MNIHHLKFKIYMGFLALLFMMGIGTYIGYKNLKEMNMFLQQMYGEHYAASLFAANVKGKISDVRAQLVAMMGETNKDKMDKYNADIQEVSKEIDGELIQWFEKGLEGHGEKMNAFMRDFKAVWNDFRNTRDAQIIPFIYQNNIQEAKDLALGIQAERYKKMRDIADGLVKMEEGEAGDLIKISRVRFKSFIVITFAMSFFVVAAYLLLSSYILRKDFSKPLTELTGYADRMTGGDISRNVDIAVKSEIGDFATAVNKAMKGMRNIILQTRELSVNVDTAVKMIDESASSIKAGSNQQNSSMKDVSASVDGLHKTARDIAKGMEQILKLSEEISSSILEMASSIEEVDGNVAALTGTVGEISASIEEIAGSLKEVVGGIDNVSVSADETASSLLEIDATAMEIERHTMEAAELSNEVAKESEKGLKAVELSHAGMETVKESVNALARVIDELGNRSREIGKILKVIDDVAAETNLLALNATIIAAQAGEHGKGFSVVADEIRELSERTAASTKEITIIISGIQEQIAKAVSSVEEGITKVAEGEKLSTETIGILEGMMQRFKTFQDMSSKIAKATQEQTAGSKKVTENTEVITKTIHTMAKAIQEQSQGSSQIAQAVERMKGLVSQIKRATSEQTGSSKIIASHTEDMMKSIQMINVVSFEQENESQKITDAVVNITGIADVGMKNAGQLEQVVGMLKKEVYTLRQSMERFKLN
ncbi:MAG: hypothetical protein A3G39_08680 [Deltaproteobacteria bacterium RIFCSPLOWO2_12_FULL_43_16]|nr:MAG: hypothetical protein A2Z89_03030 [Deltaproteobacteria bacterium GWA2_43_19]OGQ12442.1 MAG: hypothetical protein A3D30_02710 [Deltaproteobacteria bacterium RIFCSPHIGHO2_02_FULL_43_33]OGQ59415.1 MAG: hypothetical protein A3G39_08680 [Deltaproteobacteria bacterium RIFCSPLOWO2_12_FULL_43_16]HBR17836.1 hypothetical protein [Deltaproteobacteria bacterium]